MLDDLDGMEEEMRAQFLKNILNDSERLTRLINHILDFEKLSTGREQLNKETHSLARTIERAVAGVSQIAKNKNVIIVIEDSVNTWVKYDEDRIIQVLTNLLSNAIKFCEPKVGVVQIKFYPKRDKVWVFVKDNGKGIPDEDKAHIFEKFYQSKNQNIIKPEGSGLGLAISKQIIDNHHGKIWVEKNNKVGASFVFTLPFN